MTSRPQYLRGETYHARRGPIRHAFKYGVDYVLIDPEQGASMPLFSRNRFNLWAVRDRDYGSQTAVMAPAAWVRAAFHDAGLTGDYTLRLLTQPAFLGYVFNPVSFWLVQRDGDLIAVLAEVNNTFGDRHSYLCHTPDFAPLTPDHVTEARKLMHVSPFQEIQGGYSFAFDVNDDKISIRILHKNGPEGVVATLAGPLRPLRTRDIALASVRRPLGALRTSILIYWHALRLKLKGARYKTRPTPPTQEVSACSRSPNA